MSTSESPYALFSNTVIVAIPAPNVAVIPVPTKLSVPAVPSKSPSSMTATPAPTPVRPVSPEPSP